MRILLFDIDGTLLITNGIGRATIADALSDVVGRRVTGEGVSFSGRTDPAIVRDMLSRSGLSKDEVEDLIPQCLSVFTEVFTGRLRPEDVKLLPGIPTLMDHLVDREDVHLGLVTGNLETTGYAKLAAAGLSDLFHFGAFGSDHEDRNHLPAIALDRSAESLDFNPGEDQCIIIGDTEHDITCARYANMHVVAVATGKVDAETLKQHKPDLFLSDLSDPAPFYDFMESAVPMS